MSIQYLSSPAVKEQLGILSSGGSETLSSLNVTGTSSFGGVATFSVAPVFPSAIEVGDIHCEGDITGTGVLNVVGEVIAGASCHGTPVVAHEVGTIQQTINNAVITTWNTYAQAGSRGEIAVVGETATAGVGLALISQTGDAATYSTMGVFSPATGFESTLLHDVPQGILGVAGLSVQSTWTNPSIGVVTLNGATPVAVPTTAADSSSFIFLSRKTAAGTPGAFSIDSVSATGFSVVSEALDTSVLNWWIVNPNWGS